MSGWRGIESHDGSDEDVLTFGEWGIVVAAWLGGKWVTGFEGVFELAGVDHAFNPTHWQPLPAAVQ